MHTQEIVQRLWALCHVLRDDGITYHEYVTELTYLLFLKMTEETGTAAQLPEGYRWPDLVDKDGVAQLEFYRTRTRRTSARTGRGWCRRSSPTRAPRSASRAI